MAAIAHDILTALAALNLDLASPLWDLILSIAMFLSIVMLIVAVFNQPGQIGMSPQREAAIATGHTDRRTVFEQPMLRPLMWVLLVVSHRLALPRLKGWIRRTLVYAGSPNFYTPEEYLSVAMLIGVLIAASLGLFNLAATGSFSVLTGTVGFLLGTGLMLYQLHDKGSKRVRLIAKRVPYALDLIALAMGAGATFTEAVRAVVREDSEDPFNVELKTLLAERDLGTTRRRSLENLAARVPLDMLRSIVASVIQAEELGTPLADVLHSQATLLRMQRSARAENAAAVASVRILVPSLLILMGVVVAVFSPMILRILTGGGLF